MRDFDAERFRQETRDWLARHCPPSMREPMSDADVCWGGREWVFSSDDQRDWMQACVAKGYTVPQWPVEYGGAGLNAEQATILAQEMAAISARPPLQSFGIWMLGPALLKFGSEAQKSTLLPQIARGEIRWCQGYSEPGSGSDLASLKTKGVDMGDHWLVSGQKVWTSYAHKADWIFCLVRTEPDAPKHKGISFLLFDMKSEGVEARPIRLINGATPFCETFLDNVKVPKSQIVGAPGEGWTMAKALLAHERENIGAFDFGGDDFSPLEVARQHIGLDEATQRLADPMLRAQLADFLVDELAFEAHVNAARAYSRTGQPIGARSSEIKYLGSELNKRRHTLLMAAGGSAALAYPDDGEDMGLASQQWLRTKGNSIEGGTSEIMLEILSKAVLEMPAQ